MFSQLRLDERCQWLDHLSADQLAGPYNAADYLLLPSRHENFGNVVIEALACGCGVLISDRVGAAEALQQCPGVKINPRIPKRWIADIEDALGSTRPGLCSSQWVRNAFAQSSVAMQAKEIYRSILNHG